MLNDQQVKRRTFRVMARMLAFVLAVFLVVPPASGQVRLEVSPTDGPERVGRRADIIGDSPVGWTISYGTYDWLRPQLVVAGPERAYFAHGKVLRLIDTDLGLVLRRWIVSDQIVSVDADSQTVRVDIQVRDRGERSLQTVVLGPEYREPPWIEDLSAVVLLELEVGLLLRDLPQGRIELGSEGARGLAGERVAVAREAVLRDPLSPWLRIALGYLLMELGDSEDERVVREAIGLPSASFVELFGISGFLEGLPRPDLAGEAFDAGYRKFLEAGNDPRLADSWGFYLLRGPRRNPDLPEDRDAWIDRLYRLSPRENWAHLAWRYWADVLAEEGNAEEAAVWRVRSEESEAASVGAIDLWDDRLRLGVLAGMLAMVLYYVALQLRYWPERRLSNVATRKRRFIHLPSLGAHSWDVQDRTALLLILLLTWIVAGSSGVVQEGLLRYWRAAPYGVGTLASPLSTGLLEGRFPETPERDLLLALAYQQGGRTEEAERLYRRLPATSEGWNNLGVLLSEGGRSDEAREAYQAALGIAPELPEAIYNLGRGSSDFWTQTYEQYVPGRPMLAIPSERRLYDASFGIRAHAGRVLTGPFSLTVLDARSGPRERPFWVMLTSAPTPGLATFLLVIIGFLLVSLCAPRQEVTEAASGWHWMVEGLLPGTSGRWRLFGGIVLWAWVYLIVRVVLTLGGDYYYAFLASEGAGTNSWAVPLTEGEWLELFNPSAAWIYGVPAILFIVNLILVLRSRRLSVAGNP